MNATLKQSATMSQRLKLSRTMKQSLELLQYSTEELHTFLKERMEEIPFLKVNFYESSFPHLTIDSVPNKLTGRQVLHRNIRDQLMNEPIQSEVKKAIHWLVDDIEEDGLLRSGLEYYAKLIGTKNSVVAEAIQYIQTCEPAGIGATSLAESLLIQAKRAGLSQTVIDILSEYFDAFSSRKWREIERESGYSTKEIQEAAVQIGQLNMYPLVHLLGQSTQYVRPDADITGGEIRFFKHAFPEIGISHEYIQALPSDDATVKQYVIERTADIQQIRTQLVERKSTIKLIIRKITEKQSSFFKNGFPAIVPMTMTDIGKELNLHESTVSRAIREKYIHTPYGTIPLRNFFSQSATTKELVEVSPNHVKEKIKGYIHVEDKKKPLSDQKIAELLMMDGIPLSRRVIAKYREQLKIPASSYRKRLT
ncbi:RNA polymerase factor sigma-54 [Chungangia koreensis]|uniref:RNA polymerase factor sigma-54 n=1 Tax=Chungangia koreensis TaxID=752657 RepID=A0ABV8X866_9LACT